MLKAQQDRLESQSERLEQEVRLRTAQLELSRLQAVLCLARAAELGDAEVLRRPGRQLVVSALDIGLVAGLPRFAGDDEQSLAVDVRRGALRRR